MTREYFTHAEASALIGQRIKSLVEFSGVPKGTTGEVIEAYKASWADAESWGIMIQWDIPTKPPLIADVEIAGESATYIRTGKPLRDGFSRSEYYQYLEAIP